MSFRQCPFLALAILAAGVGAAPNMNSEYTVANPARPGRQAEFQGEYFELNGPLTTSRYSEVWWAQQSSPLPQAIVDRFDGKVMAITGYEVDIVRRSANGSFHSIPCYEQYNHHFSGFMHGKDVVPVQGAGLRGTHGGRLPGWRPAQADAQTDRMCDIRGLWLNPVNGISVNISADRPGPNEGEYQCSHCNHVYDQHKDGNGVPFEQLPASWVCPVCGAPKSAYQKIQLAGRTVWSHAEGSNATNFTASCVGSRGWHQGYGTISPPSPDAPQGGATLRAHDDAGLNVTGKFSTSPAEGAPTCSVLTWSDGNVWYKQPFTPGVRVPTVQVFSEGNGNEHRKSFHGYAAGYAQLLRSPVAFVNMPMIINTNKRLTGEQTPGHIASLLPRRSLAPPGADYSGILECPCTTRKVKIVDRYTSVQSESCPAVVIGATSVPSRVNTLQECLAAARQVCGNATIQLLNSSSAKMPAGCSYLPPSDRCDVVFNNNSESEAQCSSELLCMCRDASSLGGTIGGGPFNRGVCAPEPTSQLLSTNNGICNISAYEGGLHCCGGGSLLLDADQQVPEAVDSWQLRYRFYFEEFKNQSNLYRVWWSTEAINNEYDVPKSTADCLNPKTDPELCVHQIASKFKGRDMLSSGCMAQVSTGACIDPTRIAQKHNGWFKLMYAAAHCHAPSCMSLELWDNDRNQLICRNQAVYGTGDSPMDEAGYLVGIPPCVWADANNTDFLEAPLIHLDSNLTTIKRSNNTNGHWGVMALWQMRAAYLD